MFTRYLYHFFVFLFVLCGGLALIGAGLAYVLNGQGIKMIAVIIIALGVVILWALIPQYLNSIEMF